MNATAPRPEYEFCITNQEAEFAWCRYKSPLPRVSQKAKEQRNLVLPKPPKGYPTLNKGMSSSCAEYERMLTRKESDPKLQEHLSCLESLPKDEQTLELWKTACCQRWMQNGFKVLYPTPEIITACKNTDAMSSVQGSDIRTTYPAFLLVMPTGHQWTNSAGDSVSHIIANVMEEEQVTATFGVESKIHMNMPSDRYLLMTLYWGNDIAQSLCLPISLSEDESMTIHDVIAKYTGNDFHISSYMDYILSEEEKQSDTAACFAAANLIFNILLIMQSYPEYVTTEVKRARGLDTKKKTRSIDVSVVATPSRLQQVIREEHECISTYGQGKRDKPYLVRKIHMRRGHWRRQRHSVKWECYNPAVATILMSDGGFAHMKWIKPVLVHSATELT